MDKQIAIGRISKINYKKGIADVIFEDQEEEIIPDIPFMAHEYKMPQIDDLVVVIFMRFRDRNQGFILGPFFNKENLPDYFKGKKCYYKTLSDNTDKVSVKYDSDEELLTIKAPKLKIICTGEIEINGKSCKLNSDQSVAVNSGSYNLQSNSSISVVGGSSVSVKAPSISHIEG